MSMLGQFSVTIITVLAGGGRMLVPAGDWGDKSSSFSSSLGSSGLLAHQGDEYTSKLVPQIDESVKLYNHGEGPYYAKWAIRHYANQTARPLW